MNAERLAQLDARIGGAVEDVLFLLGAAACLYVAGELVIDFLQWVLS